MPPEEELSAWLISEIEHIFKASIKPGALLHLVSLAEEINAGTLLSEDHLEAVFMEILTDLGIPSNYTTTMDYLHAVYHRTFAAKRSLPVKTSLYLEKVALFNKIVKLATSYGFICFQIPEMFINNNVNDAVGVFVRRYSETSSFLTDIINTSVDQEGLLELLNVFLPALSALTATVNLDDRLYVNYLSLYEVFVNSKPVAAIFSQVDGFQPPDKANPLDYEHKTLLGPLLRLSPLVEEASTYYFTNVTSLSQPQISSIYDSIQNEYKYVCDRLFYIIDKLIRGSPETRNALLNWFATLINLSHLRRGSHADLKKIAGDGIMYNISIILIRLSSPFLDYPTYTKVDKIDVDYFSKSSLIDISEESRVNSSIQEANENKKLEQEPNFISHCFFLTLSYLHYGVGGIYIHYDRIKNQIKQYTERIEMITHNRLPPGSNPMMLQILRNQMPTLAKQLNSLHAVKNSIQAIFSNRPIQEEIFDFIVGATTFMIKLVDPEHLAPKQKLKIPIFQISTVSQLDDQDFLKTKTPRPWKYYPEFILEGIINYCKFSTNFRGCPLVYNTEKLTLFVEFAIVLLRCPELIGNPHMKADLVEVLFIGSLPLPNGDPGFIASIFNSNKLVMDNILYSLLDFYVMVERTGASSQFYDKFNSRYYISIIIEELWKSQIFRHQLTDYSENNVDFFVRFIARMLNDTTYLLDETFNELNAIHKYQQEIKRRAIGEDLNEELGSDEELAGNLESAERKAKSYMGLSNKTMELFKLFTKEVPKGFILPEIVDRLAGMLDYNLSVMVGPKCVNLKVEAPEKYDFNPRRTLTDLCEIYSNLGSQEKFVIAVSRDGRSFDLSYFQKAERILTTKTFTNPAIIRSLIEFAKKADLQRQTDEDEELELGEIPDEFLDPLMYTLMEDPVILPSSKISIDRSTIKAHLLSDSTDPFNRVPLKLEDVVEDLELKHKIESFKREKKAQKLQAQDVEMTD
ncbi:uncharacterized protein CANTADRAFT_92221 [Suhomyces tanzawaensis NRRL Y-17324]|uniref:RING-type E3 ubiquitin transferase n=1 Tax=Suhomyces tanzawaensis NRRL Y-17324 TaxID=984487 RepID=A0A1E4SC72_9ASCO|nr:uncharacterized protein CANTADRAFT_92221 [Suhomyces tanzawaensis NRRL Y-17324]ODV77076.1 hypothetical protein CANTADRAFT_92221 [Suhomyces tanzawaensis NRRL Y-17324]